MNYTTIPDSRARLLQFVGSLIAIGLLVYLLGRQGWGELIESVQRISVGRFALVLGLMFASRLAVAGRWSALLRSSDLVDIDQPSILRVTFAGMFASNFLPTSVGGDLVRLANAFKVRGDRRMYATSIIIDRVIGAAGMAMLLPVGFLQLLLGVSAGSMEPLLPALAATVGVHSTGLWAGMKRGFRLTTDAVRLWLRAPRAIAMALGFTWFHMILKFTAMWVLFDSLGESIGYFEMAGLWSLVYFVTLFPVSINGIGLQEVSAGFIYASFGGMALGSGLTVALLLRTTEMLASLPGALVLPGLIGGAARESAPAHIGNETSG